VSKLNWSLDAKNVLKKFYNVDIIIYVEGEDDIRFWEIVFSEFTHKNIKIKPAFGKENLLKQAREIGAKNLLIAMDSDYDRIHKEANNNKIILTYGYSIENTIVTETLIKELIASYTKTQTAGIDSNYIKKWFKKIECDIRPLIIADILNKSKKTTAKYIIPKKADRFIKENGFHLDSSLIENHLKELGFDVKLLHSTPIPRYNREKDIIKGHFLFSLLFNLVKSYCNKGRSRGLQISADAFYATCIANFKSSFNKDHPHYQYYEKEITHQLNNFS